MNPLDEREQRWTRRAAFAGATAFIALYASGFDEFRFVVAAAVGVAMCGLLAVAARSRKRLLTGMAALVVGFGPWGFAWVLGAPFLLLSGWLLFRAKPRERDPSSPSEDGRDADESAENPVSSRRPGRRGRRAKATAEVVVGPRRPTPNKRYTPPGGRPR